MKQYQEIEATNVKQENIQLQLKIDQFIRLYQVLSQRIVTLLTFISNFDQYVEHYLHLNQYNTLIHFNLTMNNHQIDNQHNLPQPSKLQVIVKNGIHAIDSTLVKLNQLLTNWQQYQLKSIYQDKEQDERNHQQKIKEMKELIDQLEDDKQQLQVANEQLNHQNIQKEQQVIKSNPRPTITI